MSIPFIVLPQAIIALAIWHSVRPTKIEEPASGSLIPEREPVSQPLRNETSVPDNPASHIPGTERATSHNNQKEPVPVKPGIQPILPYLDQYLRNQKNPLENQEKLYEYLKLKKFDLTPELKEQIKKKIEEAIEEQKNKQREEELGRELFGAGDEPAPVKNPPSMVIPVPAVIPDSRCQVCLSEFSCAEPGAVKCTRCGNLFHYRCITKWVNKNGTCPVCKKELKV